MIDNCAPSFALGDRFSTEGRNETGYIDQVRRAAAGGLWHPTKRIARGGVTPSLGCLTHLIGHAKKANTSCEVTPDFLCPAPLYIGK
jgi:hypothetical protein